MIFSNERRAFESSSVQESKSYLRAPAEIIADLSYSVSPFGRASAVGQVTLTGDTVHSSHAARWPCFFLESRGSNIALTEVIRVTQEGDSTHIRRGNALRE
jgi:hypothetical protein